MLETIELQTDMLRTTFDSAAHDLRGPLYRARVRIEESLQHEGLSEDARGTMEATLAELERVQRTLGTLLQIAQAEGRGRDVPTEAVDLAALARELVDLYRPEAATREITLEYRGADAATTRGNSQLLAQVLVNLIENAIKYVSQGGRIDVQRRSRAGRNRAASRGQRPRHSSGGPPTHPATFRAAGAGSEQVGSGLGLSLVAAVVRLHRGSIELLDANPGLIVRCRLPSDGAGRENRGN